MKKHEFSMLSLEEELTSVEEGALEEERANVSRNYDLLEHEKRAVRIPYPDVKPFDVGMDYNDISDIQYKKGQNKRAWEDIARIDQYLDCRKLFIGHCMLNSGTNFYVIDHPSLVSRTSIFGEPIQFINADDKNYAHLIRLWRYPSESKQTSLSRNLHMRGRTVESVDVVLDRSNQLVSGITDLFLRKALIRNKNNNSIQSIIQTIQEKQDRIRLLPKERSFVVQGCAGSGKTMVLLHRLRYMLFNKEFNQDDCLFLIPTQKFGRFIKDICSQFHIPASCTFPVQYYYRLYAGDKALDDNDEISELVFHPNYLKRVYSRQFLQEACSALIDAIDSQVNILFDVCDTALSELLKSTNEELQQQIEKEHTDAVSLATDAADRVIPYAKTKLQSFADISLLVDELQTAYDDTNQQYQSIINFDVSSLMDTNRILSQDKQLQVLHEQLIETEERVAHASVFTAGTHKKKLEALKQQYDERAAVVLQELIDIEKKQREAQAVSAMFVYDDIALAEAKEILDDLKYILSDANRTLTDLEVRLKNVQDDIMHKYEKEIELLNEMISHSGSLSSECTAAISSLEPCITILLGYLHNAGMLMNSFFNICSKKDQKRLHNHCKLLKSREDHDQILYLNQLLFNTCKRMLREEFGIKISKTYKHYWYLSLYCQYLTKGISVSPRHHLFIDEAQDLSQSEIELIRKINTIHFSDRTIPTQAPVMNLFGDIYQMITCHGINSWNAVSFIPEVYVLDENFRNTNQIVDYCNSHFKFRMKKVGVNLNAVREYSTLEAALRKNKHMPDNTVYIVKDDYALKDLNEHLQSNGIMTYEAYTVKQAKGLEFRTVCVFDDGMTDPEAYIAYTRALADLMVIKTLPQNTLNHVTMIITGEDAEDEEPSMDEEAQ